MKFEYPVLIVLAAVGMMTMVSARRPDRALHGAGAAVPGALRRGRLPARQPALDRGGAEVLRARGAVLGPAALRREPDLRLRRHHRASPGSPRRSAAAPLPLGLVVRAGVPLRRHRLQGLGGAVPHVDARRLRGLADAGDGLLRRRRPRWRRRRCSRGCCSTPSAARSTTGSRSWRSCRWPRCSSARSRRSGSATSSG